MDPTAAQGFLEEVNSKADPARVLELIGYAVDKIQKASSGGSVKAFCPLHKDTKFRSLVVEGDRNTYKCTIRTCAGYQGGTMVELYSTCRELEPVAAAAELARELNVEISPLWPQHFAANSLEEGRKLLAAKDYEGAEAAARKSLQYYPDFDDARLFIADIAMELGDPFRASEEYVTTIEMRLNAGQFQVADRLIQHATEQFPDSEDIFFLQVRSAELQGKTDEVIGLLSDLAAAREAMGRGQDNEGIYRQLVELQPDKPEARLDLAKFYESRRQIKQATLEYETIAFTLVRLGRGAEAIPYFERVLKQEPMRHRNRTAIIEQLKAVGDVNRGREHVLEYIGLQVEAQDLYQAEQAALKWLQVEPDSIEMREALFRIFQEKEMPDEASQYLRDAADVLARLGDYERESQFLFRIKFSKPEDIELRRYIIKRLMETEQNARAAFELLDLSEVLFSQALDDEAEEAIQEAVRLDTSAEFCLQVADNLLQRERRDSARDLILRCERQQELDGNLEAARDCCERLQALDPDDLVSSQAYARVLWKLGDERAPEITVRLVPLLVMDGRESAAVNLLKQASEGITEPDETSRSLFFLAAELGERDLCAAFYWIVMPFTRFTDTQAAFAMAQALVRIDPGNEPAQRDLADLGAENGRVNEAVAAYLDLARRLEQRGNLAGALEDLKKAERLDPRRADIIQPQILLTARLHGDDAAVPVRREFLRRLKVENKLQPDQILREFESFLADYPTDRLVQRELADLHARLGNKDEADARFRRLLEAARSAQNHEEIALIREAILRLDNDNPTLLADVGRAWFEAKQFERGVEFFAKSVQICIKSSRLDVALSIVSEALSLKPNDATLLDLYIQVERAGGNIANVRDGLSRLAKVLRESGRLDAALARLTELRTIIPGEIEPLRSLAEVQEELNDTDHAVSAYKELARLVEAAGQPKEALTLYAHVCNDLRFDLDALKEWSRLAETHGSVEERCSVFLRLAKAMVDERQWNDARKALARLDALVPDGNLSAQLRERLASSLNEDPISAGHEYRAAARGYRTLGETDESMRCLRLAIERLPDDPESCGMLAELLDDEQQPDEAVRIRMAQVRGLLRRGDPDADALAVVERIVALISKSSEQLMNLAKALLGAGRRDLAIPYLEMAAKAAGENEELLLRVCDLDAECAAVSPLLRFAKSSSLANLGLLSDAGKWLATCGARLMADGDTAGALETARQWLSLEERAPEAHEFMGKVCEITGDVDACHQAYTLAAKFYMGMEEVPPAATCLKKAAEAKPGDPDTQTALADVLTLLGNEQEAADVWYNAGELLAAAERIGEAAIAMEQALRIRQGDISILRVLADLKRQAEGFAAALPVYRQLFDKLESTSHLNEVEAAYRTVLAHANAPAELRASYAEWLLNKADRAADAKQAYLALAAYCETELKDTVRAVEYFSSASSITPSVDDAEIFESIARLHTKSRVLEFAAEALREAARLHEVAERLEDAIRCTQQVVDFGPPASTIDDLMKLGALQRQSGKLDAALATYRLAHDQAANLTANRLREVRGILIELDPSDETVALEYLEVLPNRMMDTKAVAIARSFLASGNRAAYDRILGKAMERVPDSLALRLERVSGQEHKKDSAALTDLAGQLAEIVRLAADSGERPTALDALTRLEKLPEQVRNNETLAELYGVVGDKDKAVAAWCAAAENSIADRPQLVATYLGKAVDIDPNLVLVAVVAQALRQIGADIAIRSIAERVLESALLARSRTRTLVLAAALLETGDDDYRLNLLRRILVSAGGPFVVAVAGAHCDWLLERGRKQEAGDIALGVTEIAPNSPDAWYLLAQISRKNGDVDQAGHAHMKAARLFNEAGALTEEETCYQEALEALPQNIEILEMLAHFYERERRVADAAEACRKVAELAAEKGDLAQSATWWRKAIALAPQDDAARRSYVDVLKAQKKVDVAVEQLVELARLKIRLGDQAGAQRCYEEVFELDPLNETAVAFLLDRATKAQDDAASIRFTIALSRIRSESGAVGQALQAVRALQAKYPENLDILQAVASLAQRAQDAALFRSSSLTLGRLLLDDDPVAALIHFESVLEQEPHDLVVLELAVNTCVQANLLERGADFAMRLIALARDRGDADRLLLAASTLITYDPERAMARQALAEAYYWLDRTADAAAEWARAAELFEGTSDLASAADCLKRVIAATPSALSVRRRLADILARIGPKEEARRAWAELHTAVLESGDVPGAEKALQKLLELAPEDISAHELALKFYRKYEHADEALDEILWLVRQYMRAGRVDAAEALLEEGERLDPESLTLQLCRLEVARSLGRADELLVRLQDLAERFLAAGDLQRAAETLEQVLREDPNLFETRRTLSRVLLKMGQADRGSLLACEVISTLLSSGETEQAREFAEHLVTEFAGVAGLAGELGELFLKAFLNDLGAKYLMQEASRDGLAPEGRVRLLERAVRARPRWAEGLRQLAEAQAGVGDTQAAVGTLDRLSTMLIEQKQFQEAVAIIRRQISLRPKDVAPRRRLVEVYSRVGDRDSRAQALQDLADLFVSLGRTDEAVDTYRELTTLRPDDPELLAKFVELFAQVGNDIEIIDEYVRLADAYAKRGQLVEATQTYEQALAIDRKNADVRDKFVNFLMQHGQRGRALSEMRKLAETHVRRGNRNNAVQVLNNALALNPRDMETCLRLAAAQDTAGEHDQAVATLARVQSMLSEEPVENVIALFGDTLTAFPDSTETRKRFVEVLLKAGRKEDAAGEARRLAELACAGGDFDSAEEAYRVVTDNAPESLAELREAVHRHAYDPNLQYMDLVRLGDWLAYHGQPEKALDEYRRARGLHDERPQLIQRSIDAMLQFLPEDEAVADYLALAERYMVLGEFGKAKKAYEHVLKLDPSNADARDARNEAFRREMMNEGSTKDDTNSNSEDNKPVLPVRSQKKPRMGMGELMDAIHEE